MWIRVTPADIGKAREELAVRRAEILARHASEVQGLAADKAQIDKLAGLVAAFILKFKTPSREAPAPVWAVLAAKQPEPGGDRRAASLEVAGFDRPVLPGETRLTPSEAAVSIDFGSRNKSGDR